MTLRSLQNCPIGRELIIKKLRQKLWSQFVQFLEMMSSQLIFAQIISAKLFVIFDMNWFLPDFFQINAYEKIIL